MFVSKDFFSALAVLDRRVNIIQYILNPQNRSGDYLIGTIKKIAKESNLSVSTTQNYLKTLENQGFLKRHGNGVYRIISLGGKE